MKNSYNIQNLKFNCFIIDLYNLDSNSTSMVKSWVLLNLLSVNWSNKHDFLKTFNPYFNPILAQLPNIYLLDEPLIEPLNKIIKDKLLNRNKVLYTGSNLCLMKNTMANTKTNRNRQYESIIFKISA